MLQFYDTMMRKKRLFRPIEEGKVRLYSCGLTVNDYAHIGNLRAYVFVDLLRRWLEYRGFDVEHVMNITDVDDKTIQGKQKEGVSLDEYTEKYIDAFAEDLKLLNIKKAKITPKATEHIEEMVRLVKILMKKGYSYRSKDGSIYFDISRFKNYGKLSKMKIGKLKAGARVKVDEYGKEQAADFALWKAWDLDDGDVFWETKLGKGRPGWHIECSAMSMKYLGKTLDIHTGGVDNIFPHHENEIAQSEAITGKKFVNYWLHNEHLLIKGERMGKSLRNFYTLRDIIDMGYNPVSVRFLLMSTHYRKQFSFTFESLEAAENALHRLRDFMGRLDECKNNECTEGVEGLIKEASQDFEDALDDDLDISRALATVFNLVREVNKLIDMKKLCQAGARQVRDLIRDFDRVLCVFSDSWQPKERKLSNEVERLIRKREAARKARDWKTADAIRDKLQKSDIILEDTPNGVKWRKRRVKKR
ncbi:MAG: cysteine--tRNA ligase [Candidatus Bathyarchaeota archaeon]|nr:MAG: cysteine--tRNA ligase [Candidatus Bathyarchaeota archaeon]